MDFDGKLGIIHLHYYLGKVCYAYIYYYIINNNILIKCILWLALLKVSVLKNKCHLDTL